MASSRTQVTVERGVEAGKTGALAAGLAIALGTQAYGQVAASGGPTVLLRAGETAAFSFLSALPASAVMANDKAAKQAAGTYGYGYGTYNTTGTQTGTGTQFPINPYGTGNATTPVDGGGLTAITFTLPPNGGPNAALAASRPLFPGYSSAVAVGCGSGSPIAMLSLLAAGAVGFLTRRRRST